jgi:unsaturated chondroitin disaccharide hydrolase
MNISYLPIIRRGLLLFHLCAVCLRLTAQPYPEPAFDANASRGERYATALAHAMSRVYDLAQVVADNRYPIELDDEGDWIIQSRGWWTNGYWPGMMWMFYGFNGDPMWAGEAAVRQAPLEIYKGATDNHDTSCIVWTSYGIGYRYTGNTAYRDVARTAAGSLNALFDPDVGTTRSWSWGSWANGSNFTTIVDNSMVNELLFEAGTWTGGQAAWIDNATTHAQTMLSHHVRPDDSTYHVVVFDENTGAVKYKATHQGYSVNSTWSRGQAWTMFGLALAAEHSGDAGLLQGARDVSDWWIAQTADRAVPPWDFDFLAVQDTAPQDSTAAAIAAVGLFRLADQVPGAHYADEAVEILDALTAPPYLTVGTSVPSVLDYASDNVPDNRGVDGGLIYADYYFVEALLAYFERFGGGHYAFWQGNTFGFDQRGQTGTLPGARVSVAGWPNVWHFLTHTPVHRALTAEEAARRPRIEAGMTDGGVALELVCEIVEATGGWQLVLEQRDPVTGQWSDVAGVSPSVTPSHQTGLKRLAWVLPEGPSGTWFRLRAEQ